MANMHLVTGYAGHEHVTAADQGVFNAAVMGNFQAVLGKGNRLAASVLTNNSVRVLDGDIFMQGRHIRLNEGSYVDLTIDNGQAGFKRNDLIVARYTKDVTTAVEAVDLVVIKGEAVDGEPADPAYTEGNIYDGGALQNDMPLYRVPIDGLNVGGLVCLFSTFETDIKGLLESLGQLQQAFNAHSEEFQEHVEEFHEHTEDEVVHVTQEERTAWNGMIPASQKGAANGVAALDGNQMLPASSVNVSDSVKEALGLEQEIPNVNDAVLGIEGKIVNIGDIKPSVLADLGDEWLLCNGETLFPQEYPELSNVLPNYGLFTMNEYVSDRSEIFCFKCINGVFIAAGRHYLSDTGTSEIYILYTTNPYGEWMKKVLWSCPYDNYAEPQYGRSWVTDILHDGSRWIVAGNMREGGVNTQSYSWCIAYATDLDEDWTVEKIVTGENSTYQALQRFVIENGYYIAAGVVQDGTNSKSILTLYYKTTFEEAWSTKEIYSALATSGCVRGVVYHAGYWCVAVQNIKQSSSGNNNASFYYIEDTLDGSWNYVNPWNSGTTNYGATIENLFIANGKWVACGKGKSSSNITAVVAVGASPADMTTKILAQGSLFPEVYWGGVVNGYCVIAYQDQSLSINIVYSDDPSADSSYTWPKKSFSIGDNFIGMVFDGNKYWAIAQLSDRVSILTAESLSGPWQTDLTLTDGDSSSPRNFAFDGSDIVVDAVYEDADTGAHYILSPVAKVLPVITEENAYVYIKAKGVESNGDQ